jgi:hypothetical protein
MIMMTLLHYQLTLHGNLFQVLVLQVKTVKKPCGIVVISCRQKTTTGELNSKLMRRHRTYLLRDQRLPLCLL